MDISMGSLGSSSQYSTPHGTPTSALKNDSGFSTPMPSNQLQPTWYGYVADTADALVLFQGAIDGVLRKVVRRPHDRERPEVIRSGAVFIYEESASGIKRWTDGVPWSPSRILGNFLIYRELEKPFPPGEKKRATKKIKSPRPGAPYQAQRDVKPFDDASFGNSSPHSGNVLPSPSSVSNATSQSQISASPSPVKQETSPNPERDSERSLVGSLTDSYAFKEGGLVKKTLSINHEGGHLHLVSYYVPEDVKQNRLTMRTDDHRVNSIQVRAELIQQQNFRSPLEPNDEASSAGGGLPSYRSSMPGQYMGSGSSSASSYMSPQSYHLPQQNAAHPSSGFYSNLSGGHTPGYTLPSGYSHPGYADYNRSMPPPTSSAGASLGHYQTVHSNAQLPMHSEQSSYMSQSSYQLQDGRPHSAEHYPQHYKHEWSDGHAR